VLPVFLASGNWCSGGLVENATMIRRECVSRRTQSQIPGEAMRASLRQCTDHSAGRWLVIRLQTWLFIRFDLIGHSWLFWPVFS